VDQTASVAAHGDKARMFQLGEMERQRGGGNIESLANAANGQPIRPRLHQHTEDRQAYVLRESGQSGDGDVCFHISRIIEINGPGQGGAGGLLKPRVLHYVGPMSLSLARTAKRTAARISTRLSRAFGPRRGGVGILMYHRVGAAPAGVPAPTWTVAPEAFRAQIAGLKALGYSIRPLGEIVAALKAGEPIVPRTTALTFDDGYACVHTDAFPVLRSLDTPATVFLATGFIGAAAVFPFDGWGKRHHGAAPAPLWHPLTWDACRAMAASGLVTLGSHTHSHLNYAKDLAGLNADLAQSLARLTAELGEGARPFAYPGGATSLGLASASMAAAVKAAGFTAAFTTDYGRATAADDPYLLPRYEVTGDDDADTIAAKLEGWHDWVGTLREAYRLPRRIAGARFGT